MNHSTRPDPSVEETASLWASRLEGDPLDAAARTELDAWLAVDPSHRALLSTYCQFSTDLEQSLPALVAAGAVTMPDVDSAPVRRSRWTGAWGWMTVTGLATAAALAVALWVGRPAPMPLDPASLATAVAQRDTLTLSDGTVVDLNAHTNLVVEPDLHERRVRLASGQAFFKVSKDPSRPFIVETPAGAVRVTGTAFDVRTLSADQIEVTVREGSVQVRLGEGDTRPATAPYQLTVGDQLTLDASGAEPQLHRLSATELDNALAWRDGHMVFENAPLHEVLTRFAFYHGRGITAAPGAADLPLSGRYGLDDLDSFFSILEQVLPVEVKRDRSGTIRVIPRAQ